MVRTRLGLFTLQVLIDGVSSGETRQSYVLTLRSNESEEKTASQCCSKVSHCWVLELISAMIKLIHEHLPTDASEEPFDIN